MKKNIIALLVALLAVIGSAHAEGYKIHYIISLPHSGDSTALYQRIETGDPAEPYTTGAIARWLHYPSSLYPNEPQELTTVPEYGLYEKGKDCFATVNINGRLYFISGYAISANDNSGIAWVEESLPKKPGITIPKPLKTIFYVLLGIGVFLFVGWCLKDMEKVYIIKVKK